MLHRFNYAQTLWALEHQYQLIGTANGFVLLNLLGPVHKGPSVHFQELKVDC
jgi:hypothetical protein